MEIKGRRKMDKQTNKRMNNQKKHRIQLRDNWRDGWIDEYINRLIILFMDEKINGWKGRKKQLIQLSIHPSMLSHMNRLKPDGVLTLGSLSSSLVSRPHYITFMKSDIILLPPVSKEQLKARRPCIKDEKQRAESNSARCCNDATRLDLMDIF